MKYYILSFLIYEFFSLFIAYKIYEERKIEYSTKIVQQMHNSLSSVVSTYEMIYDDFYARQSDDIAKYVAEANGASIEKRDAIREKLMSEYMSFFNYEKLNALNGFQIIDKNGYSLLRFHKPNQYDDKISEKRYSIRRMIKKVAYQFGPEIGILQDSYRFQYPLFYDGEYVGCYEYSLNPTALMNKMIHIFGDSYKILFEYEAMKKTIMPKALKHKYSEIEIGKERYFIRKKIALREIKGEKFSTLSKLPLLEEKKETVIEYKDGNRFSSLLISPIKDIEGKDFAWMVYDVGESKVQQYYNSFLIQLLVITLFGLLLFRYIFKVLQNRRYIIELIDLQQDMIIVSDGKDIEQANRSFLEFFGYKSLKSFKKDHQCVCDMFLKKKGYLQAMYDDKHWIEYLQTNSEKAHKVQILNLNKNVRIFSVSVNYIKSSKKYFILFRDITKEERRREDLEERANLDTLTQIYNRNRFDYYLSEKLKKAENKEEIFSLVMFDIDHFKDVNDTFGHDVGDIVLKELTKLVRSQIRNSDIFARWGGEEFMIIVSTDMNTAEMFAEKLRHSLEIHNFEQVKRVTCSFGITEYRESDTRESIMKRCDTMLYSAKEAGRNCIAAIK